MIGSKCVGAVLLMSMFIGLSSANVCYVCNSAENAVCAQDAAFLTLSTTQCGAGGVAGCFTRIVAGHTIRGCSNTMDQTVCQNEPNCIACTNPAGQVGCNNQRVPALRRTCHQCSGATGATCGPAMNAATPSVCQIFNENDRCFIERTGNNIIRGCESSRGTACSTPANCFFCGENGCNHLAYNAPNVPGSAAQIVASAVVVLTVAVSLML